MLKEIYKKMIEIKYYSKEEIEEKLDLLMSFGRLKGEDYSELMLLLNKAFPEAKEAKPVGAIQPTETLN